MSTLQNAKTVDGFQLMKQRANKKNAAGTAVIQTNHTATSQQLARVMSLFESISFN